MTTIITPNYYEDLAKQLKQAGVSSLASCTIIANEGSPAVVVVIDGTLFQLYIQNEDLSELKEVYHQSI